jgi:hypothetical protein
MSLHQVQILRIYFVPELNDTADITERISQRENIRLRNSTQQQKYGSTCVTEALSAWLLI